MWQNKITVVLASNSPRRKQLLEMMDFHVETIIKSDNNEDYSTDMPFCKIPVFLAEKKMHSLQYDKPLENKVLLTADTIVFQQGKPLGKPKNEEEARSMLKALSDNEHQVITGCCIKTNDAERTFSDRSLVTFTHLNDLEIDYYITHYRPFDKAGSYGIQEWLGLIAIKRIKGSFYNVMGLPCHKVYQEIQRLCLMA